MGGSNGKTTTKEMVGAILAVRGPALKTEGNLNNEVGLPLTLLRLRPEHVAAVVELGMNHPGEMSRLTAVAEPEAALITTVQPEHLEGLGSIEGVADAEGELFAGLSSRATAVVNLDDPHVVGQGARARGPRLGFGRAAGAEVRLVEATPRGRSGLSLIIETGGRRWPVALGFVGEHNALNAAGAFALALALGHRPEECVQGLEAARPYARRLNVVEASGGWTVVDDCYNANPASMAAALETARTLAAGGRVVAVLGDMLELGPGEQEEHVALGAQVSQVAALAAFLGPRSAWTAGAARGIESAHFLEVEPLWEWLRPRLRSGDLVLVKGSRGMRLERMVEKLTGRGGFRGTLSATSQPCSSSSTACSRTPRRSGSSTSSATPPSASSPRGWRRCSSACSGAVSSSSSCASPSTGKTTCARTRPIATRRRRARRPWAAR